MSQTKRHKTVRTCLPVLVLLVLTMGISPAFAAGDITGAWKVTMDFNGNEMFATLTFVKNAGGTYTGKWGSSDLANVKFDGEKLTFDRTMRMMGDQEMTQNFAGTLKDGKISGTMGSDQFDLAITAIPKKAKSPALGQWDIKFTVMDRDVTARLIVSEKPDGTLAGQWTAEQGEHTVSNVKFQDGKLTFTRKSKIADMQMEFETTYTGAIKGNELTGMLDSEMGNWQANGRRFGAPLIGTWEMTTSADQEPRTSMMTIDPDLTGTYESFGGETPIKDLKLEGNNVTFAVEMGFGGQTFRLDFKGKLDGKTLKGEMTTPMGANEVTGKMMEKTKTVAASTSSLVGTWELTSESPQGTRTNTLKIKPDMTGTYSFRDNETPVSNLKTEGNQVSFTITMAFNDREFTLDFKAKLDGKTLNGELTTPMGERPFTGKKVD